MEITGQEFPYARTQSVCGQVRSYLNPHNALSFDGTVLNPYIFQIIYVAEITHYRRWMAQQILGKGGTSHWRLLTSD